MTLLAPVLARGAMLVAARVSAMLSTADMMSRSMGDYVEVSCVGILLTGGLIDAEMELT